MNLRIGRAHCPTCGVVATVVYAEGAEVRCPRGHVAVLNATGDEADPQGRNT